MTTTGIIGAGHAGIKAAEALAAAGEKVVVFSAESSLPYNRPRIIALAFGQVERDAINMHPQAWYAENGIDLRLGQTVQQVDPAAKTVATEKGVETFDSLVLAMGAGPFIPPVVEGEPARVLPLWSAEHAQRIHELTPPQSRLAIIGGGILGIESALRAVKAGVRVTVIEMMPRLLPVQFGERASALIQRELQGLGIDLWTGCAVQHVNQTGETVQISTRDGRQEAFDCVVMSVGARRAVGLAERAGLKTARGVLVDENLETSARDVWGAWDLIEIEGLNRCSVLDANMQGRTVAANILHRQRGEALEPYAPTSAAVNLKFEGFELHSVGRVAGETDRENVLDENASTCRIEILDHDGKTVGAQMIGTAQDFKTFCDRLAS
jgi:nitrite reductase (NADH) large subunit